MNGGNAGWMFCDKFYRRIKIVGIMSLEILSLARNTLKRKKIFLRGYAEIC